jgi:hypothetical protein
MKGILKKVAISFIISFLIFGILFFIDNLPKDDGGNLFFFSIALFSLNLISTTFGIALIIYFFIRKKINLNITIFIGTYSFATIFILLFVFKFGKSFLFYQIMIQGFLTFISLLVLVIATYKKIIKRPSTT